MIGPLEEEDTFLSEIAFRDGIENFFIGQMELMEMYEIGLYDSSFKKELERQIVDFYQNSNRE